MRVAFIADTHNHQINVPPVDLVIHCGDITEVGTLPEVLKFVEWYREVPARHKVAIAGNHDWLFEKDPTLARNLLKEAGIVYLEDQGRHIEGLHIYGTPWTPHFCNWAFNADELDLEDRFGHIPGGLDILVTHGPAWGYCDESTFDFKTRNIGCRALRAVVDRVKPRIHAFGHNHGAHGRVVTPNTTFLNVATCDKRYKPTNPVVVIELEPR